MRAFSFNFSGSASRISFGRRLTSLGWPVMSACAFTSMTKSFGVRSTQSFDCSLRGSA